MEKRKVFRRIIIATFAIFMVIPSVAFGETDDRNIIQSPWDESGNLYFDMKDSRNSIPSSFNDQNVLYGEEAKKLFEELKKQNKIAEEKYSKIEQQKENYFIENELLDDSNALEIQSTKSVYRGKFRSLLF